MGAALSGQVITVLNTAGGQGTPEPGTIRIALCGYGANVPRCTDPAATIGRTAADIAINSDGSWQANVPGNDAVVPVGTYYTVTVKDSNGDIIQCNAYYFWDGQVYNLSGDVESFDPSQPIAPTPQAPSKWLQSVSVSSAGNYVGDGSTFLAFQMNASGDGWIQCDSAEPGNLYTFIIVQNAVGGHILQWSGAFVNATAINPIANGITIQTFLFADNGMFYSIAPAAYSTAPLGANVITAEPPPPQITSHWQSVVALPDYECNGQDYFAFVVQITQTGVVTVVAPQPGSLYSFLFSQDGIGHTVTWGAEFQGAADIPSGPLQQTCLTFVCDSAGQLYPIGVPSVP